MARKPAPKRAQTPGLDWTIKMRVKSRHVELVRVPLNERGGEEEVIEVLRGRTLSKKGQLGKLGIISDVTGQRSLEALRIAVREAKSK